MTDPQQPSQMTHRSTAPSARVHKRNDESMQLLLDTFRQQFDSTTIPTAQNTVWFADENALAYAADLRSLPCQFVSNRWDVYQALRDGDGHGGSDCKDDDKENCEFSDFIWPHTSLSQERPIEYVFYRISKEKPIVLHLLNRLKHHLSDTGMAFLSGGKQEGIKSIHSQAKKCFGRCTLDKQGKTYCLTLAEPLRDNDDVDSQQYPELRVIDQLHQQPLYSKPGVFGWKKIDVGTAFLLTVLEQEKQHWQVETDRCLDLGCGYGLITLTLGQWGLGQHTSGLLAATDNNAAALIAMEKNIRERNLNVTLWPDDCASGFLSGQTHQPTHARTSLQAPLQDSAKGFDVIACNPPFHQGFDTDTSLTDHFLHNTRQLLNPNGSAYFVVNAFIGLEKRSEAFFSNITTLANNGQFKVIKLQR